jgi:hypothetical protein
VQAIGEKGDEDMRFDAVFELMEDRPQVEIVLYGLEGRFDLDELDVELPELRRVLSAKIGSQEIAAFPSPRLAQLAAIERERETGGVGGHRDVDQTPCGARLGAGGAELHEQFLAVDRHGRDVLEPRP